MDSCGITASQLVSKISDLAGHLRAIGADITDEDQTLCVIHGLSQEYSALQSQLLACNKRS